MPFATRIILAFSLYLAFLVARERETPGSTQRRVLRDRAEQLASLRELEEGIAIQRQELDELKRTRLYWFGHTWFRTGLLWFSMVIYRICRRLGNAFDEFDRFHGLKD